MLPPSLAALAAQPHFILVKLVPGSKPGKTDKLPVDWRTGQVATAHDPACWMPLAQAAALLPGYGPGHCLGFVLREGCGLWCLDVDNCLVEGTWSEVALRLFALLPGAAVELSLSGKGLHFWGTGPVPPHKSKCVSLGLELYTELRFIALTGHVLQGDASADCTAGLQQLVAACFAPDVPGAGAAPDAGPVPEWRGPLDDEELLRRALRSTSAAGAFGGRASFADLWNAVPDVLARCYPSSSGGAFDASSADAALAQHLAFWTGRDHGRIDRLMRRSGLARDKYARDDYLHRTIAGACGRQGQVLQDAQATSPAPAAGQGAIVAPGVLVAHDGRPMLYADSPLSTARSFLLLRHQGEHLRYWQGTPYQWRGGGWVERTEADLRAQMYPFMELGAADLQPNQTKVTQALDALKAEAHIDSALRPPCWLSGEPIAPPHEIATCANGLLHLPTLVLHPSTPRYFALNAMPVALNPKAPQPRAWLDFLATVWPDDPAAISLLQEWVGYLLTPDTRQQKIMLIVGPKRSGKGTIARVLEALLGPDNVAAPTLSSLGAEFGLAPLKGKQLAMVSDARLGGKTDPLLVGENLLRISGEDTVQVNPKHVAAFAMRLTVRFTLLTNELPRLADASGALASRFLVLTMHHSHYGKEDRGLTARLLGDLPGILLWAIEGWQRLNQRGYFASPESSREAEIELADLGSPITEFVREACNTAPEAEVPVDALFSAWQAWCIRKGMRVSTAQVFGRDLRAAVPGLTQARPRTGASRDRVYRGIRLTGPQWSAVHPIARNFEQ